MPNILYIYALTNDLADVQEKEHYDVALKKPSLGYKERKAVQQNFPIRSR